MVYTVMQYCRKCANTTVHHNGKCSACFANEERAKEAAWNSQPIEAKLLDLHRRLETIERGPMRF